MTTLVWFRNDLRCEDNPALHAAATQQQPCVALYIATPQQWQQHHLAPIKYDLIKRRLQQLKRQLAALNIPLICLHCADFAAVPKQLLQFCQQHQIKHCYFNREYALNEQRRDQAVQHCLNASGYPVSAFDEACLVPPDSVRTAQGGMYKVFTPFFRGWLQQLMQQWPSPLTALSPCPPCSITQPNISAVAYPQQDSQAWPVDDAAIHNRLSAFCQYALADYPTQRDMPSVQGTSQLSPYLSIGALSVRQCLWQLMADNPHTLEQPHSVQYAWLRQLAWRDFFRHLHVAYPQLNYPKAFLPADQHIVWRTDAADFQAWQQGQTGLPIIDAAMRQLQQTGWMHNRLRMIVASFLCKHLLIDWRCGADYFMQHLIDGDFPSNNASWQWAASIGTDAVPYFRIFNPLTQSKKFDADATFIRHYLPELQHCTTRQIHDPYRYPITGYIQPIIELNHGRQRALQVLAQAFKGT